MNSLIRLSQSSVSLLQAEKQMMEANVDHEYAPISGTPTFCKASAELAFGADSQVVKDGRVSY